MSKDKVLKYCGQFSAGTLEHMEQAIENKRLIEEGRYRDLNGCPSSFGLDDHEGLCELLEDGGAKMSYKETCDMCEHCWKLALDVEN